MAGTPAILKNLGIPKLVICPTDESKRDDTRADCYLCGRCIETCPKDALVNRRITSKEKKPGI